jgi:glycosyltransferase involved in cell wall biosynthesis
MPTYNRADLLHRTIDSILSQDFDDFELLIVDDGSTDNTAEVIKEIQNQDSRLRYLPLPENRGIGFARDAGLQHVSGKYIALADSDDLWLPGKLRIQVDVLEKNPEIEILFSDFWNIDHVRGTEASGLAETQAGMKHLLARQLDDDVWLIESGVETGILRANFIAAPTMVLRAAVFEKVGSFDTRLNTPADHEFGWRAAALGATYAYIDRVLIERYRYKTSVTARVLDASMQMLEALEICRQTCYSARRSDLLNHVRAAEQRVWRILIRKYGENGQRVQVWQIYRKSLCYGFSWRTFVLFVLGLGGPQAMSFAIKLRQILAALIRWIGTHG